MKKILSLPLAILFTILTQSAGLVDAQSTDAWGTLTGKIVVNGTAPANSPENLENSADKAICMVDGKPPLDDNIMVGENGELRDVLVMMYLDRGQEEPSYHPSFDESKGQAIVIDNVKCRFEPHVLFVRPGQSLTLKNSDSVGHNCHITTLSNEHNINLPPNGSANLVLTETDKAPGEVKCDVHKWMDAVIMVRDNPYVAVTDAEGNFKIENVPAGNWKFQFWHKRVGWLNQIEIPGKEVGRRGEVELEIKPNETLELGSLSLPADSFKE